MAREFVVLVTAVLLLATLGAARAERDLADAVSLAITEATNLEEDLAADLIKGTKQARWLRRGKSTLLQAIERHDAGETSRATAKLFAVGLSKLEKAFRDEDDESGRDALHGVLDELRQWIAVGLPGAVTEAEALPDSELKSKALYNLSVVLAFIEQSSDSADLSSRMVGTLTAYLELARAESRIDRATSRADSGPCVLTDPDVHQIGGGWWKFNAGGPPIRLKGETFVDAFSAEEREFSIGSDQFAAPYINFYLVGPFTTRRGTYPVQRPPANEVDEYAREFVTGYYQDTEAIVGGRTWFFTEGTLTIDKVRLGNPKGRRRIDGTFSVTGVDQTGDARTFGGRFHVCRFQVAGKAH